NMQPVSHCLAPPPRLAPTSRQHQGKVSDVVEQEGVHALEQFLAGRSSSRGGRPGHPDESRSHTSCLTITPSRYTSGVASSNSPVCSNPWRAYNAAAWLLCSKTPSRKD